MRNLLLEHVPYKVKETRLGVWRSFVSQAGFFVEFASRKRLFGLPVLHFTVGRCPETGRSRWAVGIVAIGRKAVGVVAIGQWAVGMLFGFGFGAMGFLAIGWGTAGVVAIGQLAIGLVFGLGQFATGFVAIGQGAAGAFVLAQRGIGLYVWDTVRCSPVARLFFQWLIP